MKKENGADMRSEGKGSLVAAGTGKTMDMTVGRPVALLLRFSIPLILGNLFQQLYTFVDTVIVGQKPGVSALAALGADRGCLRRS